jgi:GxxExxY protein
MPLEHEEIAGHIIGAAYEVYRHLGCGFLDNVYQRAMKVELESKGLTADIESKIKVWYKGIVVGEYRADVFVNSAVIVEIKIAKDYQSADEAQLLNELKATGIKVGLLINFGRTKVEFKRMVY